MERRWAVALNDNGGAMVGMFELPYIHKNPDQFLYVAEPGRVDFGYIDEAQTNAERWARNYNATPAQRECMNKGQTCMADVRHAPSARDFWNVPPPPCEVCGASYVAYCGNSYMHP